MTPQEKQVLRDLLSSERLLSLGVLVDASPYVGLLPFVVRPGFDALLVHASQLARHSRGLAPGAPYSALIHRNLRPEDNPLAVPRVSLEGTVQPIERGGADYERDASLYQQRFPESAQTFALGDFGLYALALEHARFVAGFGRTLRVSAAELQALAEPPA